MVWTICSTFATDTHASGVIFIMRRNVQCLFSTNLPILPPERTYRIGPDVIRETDSQTHLGIFCDENLSTKHQVSDACVKLSSSYMNVVKNGLQIGRINPKVSRTVYKSVVLPRALYGCETWTNCAPSDMLLVQCLDLYLTTGRFPPKFAWKKTLKYHLFHKWRSKAMDSMAAMQSKVSASNVIANTGCSLVWGLVERNRK